MAEQQWTPAQWLAITGQGGDLLVSAAAGAGKTAVLAARCVHLLAAAVPPVGVDELLVLTYTNAAAAQMRRRIAQALLDHARAATPNPWLRRQLALLDQAQISTVHAFCLAVLREHFYRLGLDPQCQLLDPDEADLLRVQVVGEVLENRYARADLPATADFQRLVQAYASRTGDRDLVQVLVRTHNFMETLRDRSQWTAAWRRQTHDPDLVEPARLAVVRQQRRLIERELAAVILRLQFARTQAGPAARRLYGAYLDELLLALKNLAQRLADPPDPQAAALADFTWPRLPSRSDPADESVALVKSFIDQAKDQFRQLGRRLLSPPRDVLRQVHAAAGLVGELLDLHETCVSRYERLKRRQNVLDFADLEHLCLRLLRRDDGGPSDVARDLQRRYRYVLVDEYQDVSPVQEAILSLVRRSDHAGDGPLQTDRHPGNLFLVGDIKQSIYGFRQADPDIFLDKLHRFTPVSADNLTPGSPLPAPARLDLNCNFRSRRGIIAAVNAVFRRCLTPDFCGLDYSSEAQLVYAATCYPDDPPRLPESPAPNALAVEVHLIERELDTALPDQEEPDAPPQDETPADDEPAEPASPADLDATRREALLVARRIRLLVLPPPGQPPILVLDDRTGRPRPLACRDVAVLLRSMKNRAEVWAEVFCRAGVPLHAELSSGYFVATEVQDLMSLLRLLDNPLQDVELAAVLRSPLVGCTPSDLTAVRLGFADGPYAAAVRTYAAAGPDQPLRQKLADFWNRWEAWRTLARRAGLAQLIWQVYQDTNLLAYVSGRPNGPQRYANLLHLHDRARQFDQFANQGLARFVAFVNRLQEEDADFGPAPVLTEADDVVRLMSVHKAKGLEFPVVIVADLARRFNLADLNQSILLDRQEQGLVGARLVDPVTADAWPTVPHELVARRARRRCLAEELRILYVALTRARERLLLLASVPLDQKRHAWRAWQSPADSPLPEFALDDARAPVDWLGPALAAHPDFQPFLAAQRPPRPHPNRPAAAPPPPASVFDLHVYEAQQVRDLAVAPLEPRRRLHAPTERLAPPPADTPGPADPPSPAARAVAQRLQWKYPYDVLTRLAARAPVTELKRRLALDGEEGFLPAPLAAAPPELPGLFARRPRLAANQPPQTDPLEIGTCTHAFLQRVNLDASLDAPGLRLQLAELVRQGVFTARQQSCLALDEVARFFAHDLGRALLAQRHSAQREWPFTLALPAALAYPDAPLTAAQRNETVLVRGIIDCWFESPAGVTILDFKTDRVTPPDCPARAQAYRVQMLLYRRALQTILDKNVVCLALYFLAASQAVSVSGELAPAH